MKALKLVLIATALSFSFSGKAQQKDQQSWKMQPVTIQSRWAKQVSPANALKEYPRPQMTRANWINLNGLWDYSVTPKDVDTKILAEGKILVPYPIESALSGVKRSLLPSEQLFYRRKFSKPMLRSGERALLHFGAVDWKAEVFVNGKPVGEHTGGYTAFSMDVTAALKVGSNELVVKVFDPSDQGVGPHGKQVLNPQNIYYTPTSGIWQTVWMEVVPSAHIEALVITPDVDKGILNLEVKGAEGAKFTAIVSSESGILKQVQNDGEHNSVEIKIPDAKLWSPANPFLYNLTIKMGKDEVKSYFGMRKISIAKDKEGVDRIFLNNKPYYNLGTLDQGFWPDGLYTAPTDEALAFDIKAIKAMGFNTIRKHIKVEPARWYYWADKLGMLVWQDMVNPNQGLPEGSKLAFEQQSKEILEQLHNYPSITTWVLFNEKWGQYDQERLTKWMKDTDPSRIVNGHSGELLYVNEKLRSPSINAYVGADMTDVHSYPDPMMSIKQEGKAQVLGEFGGIGVFVDDHQWNPEIAWGYIQEKPAALKDKYAKMNEKLVQLQKQGLSASIYTQPFDVESEQNGLMTYDRAIVKIPFAQMRKIHESLNPEMGIIPQISAKDADLTDPKIVYHRLLEEYKKGLKSKESVYKLILMGTAFNDTASLKVLKADYIKELNTPYSKDEFKQVMKLTRSINDPGFNIIFKNSKQINELLGVNVADGWLLQLMDAEIQVINGASDPNWKQVEEVMVTKYGKLGKEAYLKALGGYFLQKDDNAGVVDAYTQLMDFLQVEYKDKAEIRVGGMNLNNVAWYVFELSSDLVLLNKALAWSKFSIEEDPLNYARIDTYANLLYKLGRKDEALKWERKALSMVPGDGKKAFSDTIDKMENELKTWPDK